MRIALPLIIGWFFLRPLVVSGWTMGAESMRGDVNVLNGLLAGFESLGDIPKDFLTGTHLWFLYYLLIISVSIIFLRSFIRLYTPLSTKFTELSDGIIFWICNAWGAIIVVAIPTAACLWFMDHWGMDTPDKSLVPDIEVSLLYGGFFLFGWLLNRDPSLMNRFAEVTWQKLLLCVFSMVVSVVLSSFEMNYGHNYYLFIKAGFMFSYAVMMWSLVSITIGLCKRLFVRPSSIVRYVSDASFWIYIIHLPIVLWLQISFAELPIHWTVKLVSISFITVFVSVVLYDAIIRSTFIGAALNGKRKPRRIFNVQGWTIKEEGEFNKS
jgi:hypothetical protein